MSPKTKNLLIRISRTDDCSLPLRKANATEAQNLVDEGFAVFIPKSTGGADIALTTEGIDWAEQNKGEEDAPEGDV